MMQLDPQLLDEAGTILRGDQALHELAVIEGIQFAGLSLGQRAEPDVDNATDLPYWHRLKAEIRILLCTDDSKYVDLRRRMTQTRNATEKVGVPAIAAAIANAVSLEVALITPFVSLLLVSIGQVSVGAWCSGAGDDDRRKLSPE